MTTGMTYMQLIALIGIGIGAGLTSGMFGVGGGLIIVPAMVLLFGMTEQSAVGTSLIALLLPVGLLGVIEYYRAGKISMENISIGLIIAAGLFAGAYFGAKIATHLSNDMLRKGFAVFMGIVAIHLWFK
ncbi:MAG: sulfite exporter TauE/SafE family protein [Chlorobiaceae bacterium]